MAVATGKAGRDFNGLIRNNDTANFIFERLLTETTESAIVDAMLEEYDAPRDVVEEDVHRIIAKLREAGLLDE